MIFSTLPKHKTKLLVSSVIYFAIFLFLILYVRSIDYSKLSELSINFFYIFLAIPFSILSRIFLPYTWISLIKFYTDVRNVGEYWQLNLVYAKTWLGKYVPGNFTWIAGKIFFASERGISKTVLGITAIVEVGLQLLTALVIGLVFLFASGAYNNFPLYMVAFFLTAAIAGIIFLFPPIFNRLLTKAYAFFKKRSLERKYFLDLRHLLKIASMYFCIHMLSFFPIYFLLKAMGINLGFMDLLYVTGTFIFAGAIGTLVPFVPSGLGVREGVSLVLLNQVISHESSLALVIILRLWTVILDLCYWLFSYAVVKVHDFHLSRPKT